VIAIDTNVLARLLVGDDEMQAIAAQRLIAQHDSTDPIFVGREVIIELVWLLTARYKYPVDAVRAALDGLFMSANLAIEDEETIKSAIYLADRTGADIADAIIGAVAVQEGCAKVMTFDKDAAKRIPGMELLA
jgi:predicted nucleic-acid-binding protein